MKKIFCAQDPFKGMNKIDVNSPRREYIRTVLTSDTINGETAVDGYNPVLFWVLSVSC